MSRDHERGQSPGPSSGPDPPRLSRLETLSAWLGLWKPRDVEVPPVPKRRIAIGALVLLLVAVAAVAIPAIDSGKEEGEALEARESAEARAAERRRLREEQRAQRGRGRPARDIAAQLTLLAQVRASIEADAERRIRAGELEGSILRAECDAGRRERSRRSFDCTAVTSEFERTGRNVPGVTGYPFIAVVDFETGRYSWCKTNPVPGERVIPDPRDIVELPRECVL